MEKQNSDLKYIKIILVMLLIIGAEIAFITLDKKAKSKTPEQQPVVEEKKEENDEEEKIEYDEIIWTNEKAKPHTVYYIGIKDNNLYVNNTVIEKNVEKYFDVKLGGADTCEGNKYIVVLKEDTKISALSVDSLSCGNQVKYVSNIKNLSNVKKVYYRVDRIQTDYEPETYNVYVDTEDEEKILITEDLQ